MIAKTRRPVGTPHHGRQSKKGRETNGEAGSNKEPCSGGGYRPFYNSRRDGAAEVAACGIYSPFYLFSTGSHELTPEDRDHIRDVAGMMHSTPAFTATIIGKADSVGSADLNQLRQGGCWLGEMV